MRKSIHEALENKSYFKLICGAGNENLEIVRHLVKVYTAAGAHTIDLAAKPEIVKAAVKGVAEGQQLAKEHSLNSRRLSRPALMVSVGFDGDLQFDRPYIDLSICDGCMECIDACPYDAINQDLIIQHDQCERCNACPAICRKKAIIRVACTEDSVKDIAGCLYAGAETVEMHIGSMKPEKIKNEVLRIGKLLGKDGFISICAGCGESPELVSRQVASACFPQSLVKIIQAEGVPMSGSIKAASSLPGLLLAKKLLEDKHPVYIHPSGGVNLHTGWLARHLNIKIDGVGVGTYARSIIDLPEQVSQNEFDLAFDIEEFSVQVARHLIHSIRT